MELKIYGCNNELFFVVIATLRAIKCIPCQIVNRRMKKCSGVVTQKRETYCVSQDIFPSLTTKRLFSHKPHCREHQYNFLRGSSVRKSNIHFLLA